MKQKKGSVNQGQGSGPHPIRAAKSNKRMKNSVYSLMNNIKWANILLQGSQKEKKKGKKSYLWK